MQAWVWPKRVQVAMTLWGLLAKLKVQLEEPPRGESLALLLEEEMLATRQVELRKLLQQWQVEGAP